MNIILDPIFILPWGLNMGAEGAGLATFLSNCVACLYFFVLLYKKKKSTFVCVNPKRLSMDGKIIYGICAVGIPASIQNLLNVTGMTILNNFTSSFGADAVAAMGITQKINMVPMNIAMGISQGIMPLISYTYSSGNHKRMKGTLVFAARASLGFITVVAAFYYLSSAQLTEMFMSNEAIISYGNKIFKRLLPGIAVFMYGFPCSRCVSICGNGKRSSYFCYYEKDYSGNTGTVYFKLSVSFVWFGLCTICGRNSIGSSGGYCAGEAV